MPGGKVEVLLSWGGILGGSSRRFILEDHPEAHPGGSSPEIPEIPEVPELPEVPDMPEPPEIPAFPVLLHGFRVRFSSFFEVAARERLDSQSEGPNLRFCWQAQYFQGFAGFAENSKTRKNRRKITTMQFRARDWRGQHDFFTAGSDLASILVASARSRVLLGALSGPMGCLCRRSGCSWTPGTPQDTPEALLERSWAPRGVLRGLRD